MKEAVQSHRPQPVRRDRLIQEYIHDPYKATAKRGDPSVCPQCGAIYEDGRWRWGDRPVAATEQLCQACHRINDHYPAGTVTLTGAFALAHRDEIVALARHQEAVETGEHPLHRIMAVDPGHDAVTITTTDIHLPRRIGEAIHKAYHGDLALHYDEGEYLIHVGWRRD